MSKLDYASPAGEYDPYALTADAAQEPPGSLGRALRNIGPGLILAGAIVGTGELIATTNLGARAGFTLLWLVIVSCFVKVFVQAELGRYTISSGRTTLAGFRDIGPVGTLFGWWWIGMMLLSQLQLGAMVGGIGHALHLAMPGVSPAIGAAGAPELPWAIGGTIITAVILATGSYRVVERVTMLLVVFFTLGTVACVLMLPATGHPMHWGDLASGLTFSLPGGATTAAIAMFGITGVGATELVAYPYWCIEKGYAKKTGPREATAAWLARARGWLAVMRLDVWTSLVVYTIATLAFYILGAATLHGGNPAGLPKTVAGMTDALTQMYVPVFGQRGATWFIVAGVIAVLYSTVIAASAGNARTLVDFMHVNRLTTLRSASDRTRWVRIICVTLIFVDLLLFAAIKNPVNMVIVSGFVQALTLPMIAGATLFLRYKRTDPRLRPTLLWDLFLWLSSLALLATAVYGLWDGFLKLTKT